MGSRPSASIDSGEARGRQSGVVHPREEDEASDAFARRMALPNEEDLSSHEFASWMGMPGREGLKPLGSLESTIRNTHRTLTPQPQAEMGGGSREIYVSGLEILRWLRPSTRCPSFWAQGRQRSMGLRTVGMSRLPRYRGLGA